MAGHAVLQRAWPASPWRGGPGGHFGAVPAGPPPLCRRRGHFGGDTRGGKPPAAPRPSGGSAARLPPRRRPSRPLGPGARGGLPVHRGVLPAAPAAGGLRGQLPGIPRGGLRLRGPRPTRRRTTASPTASTGRTTPRTSTTRTTATLLRHGEFEYPPQQAQEPTQAPPAQDQATRQFDTEKSCGRPCATPARSTRTWTTKGKQTKNPCQAAGVFSRLYSTSSAR